MDRDAASVKTLKSIVKKCLPCAKAMSSSEIIAAQLADEEDNNNCCGDQSNKLFSSYFQNC